MIPGGKGCVRDMRRGGKRALKVRHGKLLVLLPLITVALICTAFAIKAVLGRAGTNADTGPGESLPAQGEPAAPRGTAAPNDAAQEAAALEAQKTAARAELLTKAERLYQSYFYDEVIALLDEHPDLANAETEALAKAAAQGKAALVKYEDGAKHVFFHSLIVYPELAFDNKGHPAEGYNMWMTTVSEFKKMLPLFYEGGYVLYDIESLVNVAPDGTVTQADIMLPPGKKPLIISIDDVDYYDYMKPDGFADRLTVNDKGDVVTVVRAPDGTESETYDGDVMPILDEFVKAHPDFSYRGAKGVVATTGYQGAFGYRITDLEGDELAAAIEQVKKISSRLRETGWKIASHSYTHNGYFRDGTITLDEMKSDTDRWNTLIRPAVGDTPIYISPFGVSFKDDDIRYRYLMDNGFHIYCPVGANMGTYFNGDNMVQNRLNLDGYTMIKHPERVSKYFFDPALVLDPARPPLD